MSTLRVHVTPGEDGSVEVIEGDELAPWAADASLTVAGKSHPRLEGAEKVTGRAQYSYDVRLPRQLYASVLRSPHPHARITQINTSRAEALPGVHAAISSDNTPEISWYEDSFVFDRTVRFIGDEVAAVAAESDDIARDALLLIDVTYERLPFVTELKDAVQPDAPKIRENGNIVKEPTIYERGDAEAGLREADVVVEATYETQVALHNSLEPHGCTASWEGESLTLWDSTQSIFTVRQQVAEKLGLPEHRVRVIKQHMGGGFGAKQISWKHDIIAALLSQRAGRPVQLMLDREAENLATGNRNPTRQHVRLGATRDGRLTAIAARIEQGAGAYMTGGEASDVSATYQTLYQCSNVRTEQIPVYTNTGPAVAFRAPGHVEAAFALEQGIDELARKLEIDPVDFRLRNYAETDQTDGKPLSLPEGLRGCYDRVTAASGWSKRTTTPAQGSIRRGVGFAAHDWAGGSGHPPGYAWVKLNDDGTLDVITGTQDIGTGTRTGLAQIAAEELGVPMDRIAFHLGDTATGPYSPVSSGSATQATIGPAVRAAAAQVKIQLLDVAATMMEVPAERLSVRDGKIVAQGGTGTSMAIEKVTQAIAPHTILGQGARAANPEDVSIKTFGAQFVELEVDIETGEITILRFVTSHDCGRIINPMMVDSQIIGGITQGIGYALTEERVVDDRLGLVLNANLEEYKVPTVADIPPIEHARLGIPDLRANPTGAKGIGEPPLIPTAPAIANAIYDAIGIRFHELPLSRRHILAALTREHEPTSREVVA